MIKNRDIIIVGIQPWDIAIGSNCKNIALEFAKNNRVLYVNSPTDRVSKWKERNTPTMIKRRRVRKGIDPALIQIDSNLWNLYPTTITESINWIGSSMIFNFLNRINAKRFSKDINMALKNLNFKDPILFNDNSMFLGLHLKQYLNPILYIYYIRDFLIKNPYWKKHGVELEPRTIANAHLVVTNSNMYAQYASKFNPNSYMVGQGCDTVIFNEQITKIDVPFDIKDIPSPIVGYVGFLSSRRLSIEILEHIAHQMPDWSIVLVGPEDPAFKASTLHSLNNVYFLGSREPSELPGYIKGFDVAINPQLINDATMGNYPRKIDEYLTLGKPIVATSTKAMDYFSDYVYLGNNKEDYVSLIKKAYTQNNIELKHKRTSFGSSHSWENNVKQIYNYITIVAKEKRIKI